MNKFNKIFLLIAFFIISNTFAEETPRWAAAFRATEQIANGKLPSEIAGELRESYSVIMVDDKNVILGIQDSSGGLAFILRSDNQKVLYRHKGAIMTVPVGHADNNSNTRWESAMVDLNQSSDSWYYLIIKRENSVTRDTASINRINNLEAHKWFFK